MNDLKTDLTVEPFDVLEADEEGIREWYRLRSGFHREVLPEDPEIAMEECLSEARALGSIQNHLAWAAWDGSGSMAAYCRTHTSKLGYMKHHAIASILVAGDMRRRGIGTMLLGRVLEGAIKLDRGKLRFFCSDRCPAGAEFLEIAGAEKKSQAYLSQLRLSEVDRALMEKWLRYPSSGDSDIGIGVWTGHFPEDRIEEIARFYQTVINNDRKPGDDPVDITPDVIRKGDETALREGSHRLIVYATGGDDSLLGFTEVLWSDGRPAILRQGYTAVLPSFRRMGIGRRLKAEMMAMVLSELPGAEVMRAGNDLDRAAIRKINEDMGYRPFIVNQTWEADASTLEEYLSSRN